MNKINLILLAIISFIAICIDCYAGYFVFLMTVMSLGSYYTIPYFSFVFLITILFVSSTIGICVLKKWAYRIFFTFTIISISFLLYIYVYIYSFTKKYFILNFYQIFLMAFFIIFIIYFLLPSTRRIFKK